ncbi:MAG: hypothetical protein FJZ63_02895 [Chlamydiae bacterium]|nr:hypothetical protein [Chlamydiota bacterium]
MKFVPSSVIRSTHPSATVLPPAVPSLMLPGRVANGMGSHLATQQEVVVCQKELPITRDELAPQTAVADSIAPDYVAVDTSGLDLLARVAEELTMGSHEALKRKAEGEQEGSKPKRAH